jgi:hypothetical protein
VNLAIYRKAFAAELRRLSAETRPDVDAIRRRIAELSGVIANMVSAIATGTHSPALLAALERAEADKARAEADLSAAVLSAKVVTLPANLDALFRDQIAHLETELTRDVDAAREILRDMLGTILIGRQANALVAVISVASQDAKYANSGSGGRI